MSCFPYVPGLFPTNLYLTLTRRESTQANCWFYTSFLQEYLGANGNRGYFTTGGAIRMELAASLRTRIRQALQRYERVESKDSRRTSGSSLSRVKSLEMVSSLQTPQTAYGTLSGLAPAYPQSGAEYNQLGALNDADRISPSTSASQIFDQFQALNRDIREFCDDVAERIGVSYTLPSDETFCQCHPVWKAMRGFQTSEDYIYFCLLSIMSSQIYDQIFTPFHPASTDEENRSQSLEYERRLKTGMCLCQIAQQWLQTREPFQSPLQIQAVGIACASDPSMRRSVKCA